jgi:hypothetical protein
MVETNGRGMRLRKREQHRRAVLPLENRPSDTVLGEILEMMDNVSRSNRHVAKTKRMMFRNCSSYQDLITCCAHECSAP